MVSEPIHRFGLHLKHFAVLILIQDWNLEPGYRYRYFAAGSALTPSQRHSLTYSCSQCSGSGIRCLFDSRSGMGKKSISGPGIRIRYDNPGSCFRELRNNFCDQKYLISLMRIRIRDSLDPGSGMEKILIRDKHPGSATPLVQYICLDFLFLSLFMLFIISLPYSTSIFS